MDEFSRSFLARLGPGWAARGAPVIYTNYNSDVLKVEILVAGPRTRNTAGPDIHHSIPRPGQYSTLCLACVYSSFIPLFALSVDIIQ